MYLPRRRLSNKLTFKINILIIAMIAYLAIIPAVAVISEWTQTEGLVALISFELFIFFVFSRYRRVRTLEFDDRNLYRPMRNGEEIIPLANVQKVYKTKGKLDGEPVWKVDYVNDSGKMKTVQFSPQRYFDEFEDCVKNKNPEVVFQASA